MKLRAPISMVVAIFVGILVLVLYFIPYGPLLEARALLFQWVMILAAFALLVGVFNLLQTHLGKIRKSQPGSGYSVVILVSFIITVVVVGYLEPSHWISQWIFNSIAVPIESSLMALLAIVLAYACTRLLARRLNAPALIFAVTAVLVLLGTAPLFLLSDVPAFIQLRAFIMQWLAVGGGRGLLLGVGLGTLAVGARILMGVDRPYGG